MVAALILIVARIVYSILPTTHDKSGATVEQRQPIVPVANTAPDEPKGGNTIKIAGTNGANSYAPAGFVKDDPDVGAPGGSFRLEQWNNRNSGPQNVSFYQTWLVPRNGKPVRLPEERLSTKAVADRDSGSIGYPSVFQFSPDAKYLVREQKIFHGANAVYLYKRLSGLEYEVCAPSLYVRAGDFFTQNTGLKWDYIPGLVNFSAWERDDRLVLTLHGSAEGKKIAVDGWRCVFDPSSGQFAVRAEWRAANESAFTPRQIAVAPAPQIPGERFVARRLKIVNVPRGEPLNLRERADGSSGIVTEIPLNATGVIQAGEGVYNGSDLWIPVQFGNYGGFIHSRFLTPETGTNTATLPPVTPVPRPVQRVPRQVYFDPLAPPTIPQVNAPPPDPPVAMPPPVAVNLPGEQYPQTRLRPLRPEDLQNLTAADLRYAINEIYARHGADFQDRDLRRVFARFSWYRPRTGSSFEQTEAFFTPLEADNLKLLGAVRDARKGGVNPVATPVPAVRQQNGNPSTTVVAPVATPPPVVAGVPKPYRIQVQPKRWSAPINVPQGYKVTLTTSLGRMGVLMNERNEQVLFRNPTVAARRDGPQEWHIGISPFASLDKSPRTHDFAPDVRTLRVKSEETSNGDVIVNFVPQY